MNNLDNRITNVDQLLTQDIEKFCNSLTELYSNISKVSILKIFEQLFSFNMNELCYYIIAIARCIYICKKANKCDRIRRTFHHAYLSIYIRCNFNMVGLII